MNLDYEISELAKQDLEDIWLYTFEKWSANQANKYYEQIIEAILLITKNPKIGKSIG